MSQAPVKARTDWTAPVLIEPKVFHDQRGYFFESYNYRKILNLGIQDHFVQDNQSLSGFGTLRGLHFQTGEFAQAKLIRVLSGKVLDVCVDLRKQSSHYKRVYYFELSAENKKQVYIPIGFAHGFIVLSEQAEFFYKCDRYYSVEHEGGVRYDDSELKINWSVDPSKILVAAKDQKLPSLAEAEKRYDFNNWS